ncbi:hypothetical protein V5O48_016645 [Marasmius crinis-equi]|uniref:Uncharacterized protein n=1 Tax=Marasmius crinis-equi TaxID=585013 RepID=A0ABR3ER50_9AGAR
MNSDSRHGFWAESPEFLILENPARPFPKSSYSRYRLPLASQIDGEAIKHHSPLLGAPRNAEVHCWSLPSSHQDVESVRGLTLTIVPVLPSNVTAVVHSSLPWPTAMHNPSINVSRGITVVDVVQTDQTNLIYPTLLIHALHTPTSIPTNYSSGLDFIDHLVGSQASKNNKLWVNNLGNNYTTNNFGDGNQTQNGTRDSVVIDYATGTRLKGKKERSPGMKKKEKGRKTSTSPDDADSDSDWYASESESYQTSFHPRAPRPHIQLPRISVPPPYPSQNQAIQSHITKSVFTVRSATSLTPPSSQDFVPSSALSVSTFTKSSIHPQPPHAPK